MNLTEATQIINTCPDATLRKAMQALISAQITANTTYSAAATKVDLLEDALQGDMVLDISPETVDRTATSEAWTRTVTVTLQNAAGDTHTWCNMAFATSAAIADTSSLGTASIVSTTLTLVNGVASIVVSGSEHAWEADETNTLTISNLSILGYTVTGGTSVETIVAAE
jgi:hypothetical protein